MTRNEVYDGRLPSYIERSLLYRFLVVVCLTNNLEPVLNIASILSRLRLIVQYQVYRDVRSLIVPHE